MSSSLCWGLFSSNGHLIACPYLIYVVNLKQEICAVFFFFFYVAWKPHLLLCCLFFFIFPYVSFVFNLHCSFKPGCGYYEICLYRFSLFLLCLITFIILECVSLIMDFCMYLSGSVFLLHQLLYYTSNWFWYGFHASVCIILHLHFHVCVLHLIV